MKSQTRGILTMAYGANRYLDMAKALARSLQLHWDEVPRAIVTDSEDEELAELFDIRIPLKTEFGSNVRQKLYIDVYSPFEETVFVDCDCLFVQEASFLWSLFEEAPFGVTGGRYLRKGDHDPHMDVDRMLARFDLKWIPKFNGGLCYFDRSDKAVAFFETVRDLLSRYKELGLAEFRGDGPRQEGIIALAMAIHGLKVHQEGGRGMRTPLGIKGHLEIDVLEGKANFEKHGRHVHPAIVHFPGIWSTNYYYLREMLKLSFRTSQSTFLSENASWIASIIAMVEFAAHRSRGKAKGALRRIKRAMRFGDWKVIFSG